MAVFADFLPTSKRGNYMFVHYLIKAFFYTIYIFTNSGEWLNSQYRLEQRVDLGGINFN